MKYLKLPIDVIEPNAGQITGLPVNPRRWERKEMQALKQSLRDTPELFDARGLIVYPYGGKYVVMGGNMRLEASKELKLKEVPCIVLAEDTPIDKLKQIVIKDNGSFGAWDLVALQQDWGDLPLAEWGVAEWEDNSEGGEEMDAQEIERKRKEFEERMKAGEISEEDEEYQQFLEKFKLAKTTDDCYTPAIVHEAVVSYVEKRYNLNRKNFVRPFYPAGDYQKEKYKAGDVVVDNPPFSILAEILRFYDERGVKYFLYAPTLTQFSSISNNASAIVLGVTITYENGANVNTSFFTNLEPVSVRFRSAPDLYQLIKQANDENLRESRKELPKYSYDKHVVTAALIASFSRYGVDFSGAKEQTLKINELDSQKDSGKAIFGSGYLCSDQICAEREKAEREKADVWVLSDRERAIVAKLSSNTK